MDIRCRKTTCKYNKTHSCFADKISVTHDAKCGTYVVDDSKTIKKENKVNDMSKTLFDVPIKDSPHRSRKTIKIGCRADCLFNDNGVCRANGITINDLRDPVCMSYLKR
jgi:hypothetical protein